MDDPIGKLLERGLPKEQLVHGLLDAFSDYINELVAFGESALSASISHQGKGDHLLPSFLMYRHQLECLGSIGAQVRAGWGGAADPTLRTQFEGLLYFLYLTSTDQHRRGYAYIAFTKIRELNRLRILDPSHPSGVQYRARARKDRLSSRLPRFDVADVRRRIAAIENIIDSPPYEEPATRMIGSGPRMKWYSVYSPSIRNIEQLALHLDLGATYDWLYRALSRTTHSENVLLGRMAVSGSGRLLLRSLTSPEDAQSTTLLATSLASDAAKHLLECFAPREVHKFAEWWTRSRATHLRLAGKALLVNPPPGSQQ